MLSNLFSSDDLKKLKDAVLKIQDDVKRTNDTALLIVKWKLLI
jgi:hypothetical protein